MKAGEKGRTLDAPGRVRLADFDPADTSGMDKEAAERALPALEARLRRLQELLYAADRRSVLVVLQGLDTAGKDGTIKHVMANVNPAGCQVWSFKQPTPDELAHDFLWRVHLRTPARGVLAIFNRSHYEDVLVARVHELVPRDVWQARYAQINDFEHLLAANGTILLKFFLHLSKEEQERRLLAREDDKDKAWKLSLADWRERERWHAYREAYEDALGKCAAAWAPWYVVPADKKWYRDLFVARALVERLEHFEHEWTAALEERGRAELAALRAAHLDEQASGEGHAPGPGGSRKKQ